MKQVPAGQHVNRPRSTDKLT